LCLGGGGNSDEFGAFNWRLQLDSTILCFPVDATHPLPQPQFTGFYSYRSVIRPSLLPILKAVIPTQVHLSALKTVIIDSCLLPLSSLKFLEPFRSLPRACRRNNCLKKPAIPLAFTSYLTNSITPHEAYNTRAQYLSLTHHKLTRCHLPSQ